MADSIDRQTLQQMKQLSRRQWLAYSTTFGSAFLASQGFIDPAVGEPADLAGVASPHRPASLSRPAAGPIQDPGSAGGPQRRFNMKKSINLWALPYPEKMDLRQCLQLCRETGFDGVELNYALEGDLSPEASDQQVQDVAAMAQEIGIEIAGLCSFLFWPFPLTHGDPQRRRRALDLALDMIRVTRLLGTKNLLIVPGAVGIPWLPEEPPVAPDLAEQRAWQAMRTLVPAATEADVYLNIENIFTNGFLHSPQEMIQFVDGLNQELDSDRLQIHFDTGNIMQYHVPEHWIPMLGQRIRHVHMKEFNRNVQQFNLHTFRPLLDGSTHWPAVMQALDQVGYTGYLTFEYFTPFPHYPEVLVYQTSLALDRLLAG